MSGDSIEVLSIILENSTLSKVYKMTKFLPLTFEISKNILWFILNILGSNTKIDDFLIFIEIVDTIIQNNCYDSDIFENCMLVLDRIVKKNPCIENLEMKFNEISQLLIKIIYYVNTEYEKLKDTVLSYFLNFFGMFLMGKDEIIEV